MTLTERIKLAKGSQDPVVLDQLSRDESWWVRLNVVENPSTPVEALGHLSRDERWEVRTYVAENPNTSVETLNRLSRDGYGAVRYVVADNPKWQAVQESGLLDVANLASKWLNIL